jgi:hypothetical protein
MPSTHTSPHYHIVFSVLNQEEHHRTRTFREEYLDLLRRGLVE